MTPFPDAAIVLAGGQGRRLGGVDKAMLLLGGQTLLDRAIRSADGSPVIVAGPARPTERPVTFRPEDPPGGGPAAALAAGVTGLHAMTGFAEPETDHRSLIGVIAVDHVGVGRETWVRLAHAAGKPGELGAVLVAGGRWQYAVGVVTLPALRRAADARESWHGASLKQMLAPVITSTVAARDGEADDIDTPAAWRRWQQRVSAADTDRP